MHTTWRPPPNTHVISCVCFYIVPSISLHLYLYPQAHACTWSMWELAHIVASQEQVSGAISLLPLWVPETELRSSGLLGEYFSPRRDLTFIISNTQRRSLYPYCLRKDTYSATSRVRVTSSTSSICWCVESSFANQFLLKQCYTPRSNLEVIGNKILNTY